MTAPATPMTTIPTARLLLRAVSPENAATLWRIMQSPNLREYQDVPRMARDEFERRVAQRPKRFDARAVGRFEWVLLVAKAQTPIGWVSLRIGEQMRGSAELGYSLLAEHRSAGYAIEAVVALVGAAFRASDLKRIDACTVPENLPSRRLLERLGFRHAKTQCGGAIVRGRAVDVMIFEMTRQRWDAIQSGSANSIVIPASAKAK